MDQLQIRSTGAAAPAFARAAAMSLAREHRPGWLRDHRFSLALSLMAWLLIVQMIVPDNLDYTRLSGMPAPTAGGPVSRMIWLGLLATGIIVLAWRRALAAQLLRHINVGLLLFVGLAAASSAWSIDPAYTVRRMIRVATFVVDACALTLAAWQAQRFQAVIRPVITLVLAGSLLFGLLCPELAIHQETQPELLGAWRGLTNHKNSLGAISCLAVLFWSHAWFAGQTPRWRAMTGFVIGVACLLLSRSSTSLMAALVSVPLVWMLQRPSPVTRSYLPWVIGFFVVGLTLYSLIVMRLLPGMNTVLGPLTALAGKDPSLTGRAGIWQLIQEHIAQHPLLGTGYGAYWTGPQPATQSYAFVQRLRFYPGSAHNGYLEVFNDLGLAGGLCLLGFLSGFLRQCLQLLRLDLHQAALYLGLLVQEMVMNLSETHWFSVLSVNFAIFVMASAALSRALLEQHLRQRFGEPELRSRIAAGAVTPALSEPAHAEA